MNGYGCTSAAHPGIHQCPSPGRVHLIPHLQAYGIMGTIGTTLAGELATFLPVFAGRDY
jgi:hypothetical protein